MSHNPLIDGWTTEEELQALVQHGDILECPCCGRLSAYAWQDTNIPGESDYESDYTAVYHVGACSGLGEWQCGYCKQYLVEADSVLLAECFTHYAIEEE